MNNIHDTLIVGSGLSGLAIAHFLEKKRPDMDIILLEKASRAGGAIRTFQEQGFQAEWGPHGFLDNIPESRELLRDTGLDQEAQRVPLNNFLRFLCHNGKLIPLPQNPKKILTTPLIPFWGKMRILADLWTKPIMEDQTIGQWAVRRFGKSVHPLVDAAVTGTFSGDLDRMSIDSVMPGLRALEKESGSVLLGLKKKKKSSSLKNGLPSMINFPQGMERLIEILAKGKPIRFGTGVKKIEKKSDIWEVRTDDATFGTRALILALPVNQALKLLSHLDRPPVKKIPVSKIINVVMGFSGTAKVPRGFGYLAPERENRFTLGAMFSSHMFPGRAPEGQMLLEALVGGRRHPERLDLEDDDILRKVYNDLSRLMKLPEPPLFSRVLRSTDGIPQLEMDHPALMNWLKKLAQKTEGLYISGFGWDGIGINDMIKSAKKTARIVAEGEYGKSETAAVKGVYF
ncbi:MAG: protoporphyrinogen oxidase [Desulfobulbaceae bacterium]|nr:protoporphyrinogen oxidase [Desulfobulbaceae bacterium]